MRNVFLQPLKHYLEPIGVRAHVLEETTHIHSGGNTGAMIATGAALSNNLPDYTLTDFLTTDHHGQLVRCVQQQLHSLEENQQHEGGSTFHNSTSSC